MKKGRFSEEQIIGILKQHEAGRKVADLAREHATTLTEMELTLNLASAICPHSGSVNVFPGFSQMLAFTCRACGEAVQLASSSEDQAALRHSRQLA